MAPGQSLDRNGGACCAAVENFVHNRHLEAHRRKVAASRTLIQNKWSDREEVKIQASRRNVKREQKQEERFAGIEKENYRLLGRMGEIDRRTPAKSAAQIALQCGGRSGGRSNSVPVSGAGSKANNRLKEMRRIDAENQRLLQRLQGAKASVNINKFDEAYAKQQKFMRMRCEHVHKEEAEAARIANAAVRERFFGPRQVEEGVDPEMERLLRIQDEFRKRAEEEPEGDALDEFRAAQASRPGSSSSRPRSSRSAAEGDAQGFDAGYSAAPPLEYAGVIPESSQKIVEELMAMHDQQARQAQDSEEEAQDAKEAAAAAFRAATSLDVASSDLVLGYGALVQRSSQPGGYLDS